MKYMLLIYETEQNLSEAVRQECYEESIALTHELAAKGQFVTASPLQSISTATSVQVRQGKNVVKDGPFAETREQLGGYFIVEVEHLDEAISIAARLPSAKRGTVEIRPMVDLAGIA